MTTSATNIPGDPCFFFFPFLLAFGRGSFSSPASPSSSAGGRALEAFLGGEVPSSCRRDLAADLAGRPSSSSSAAAARLATNGSSHFLHLTFLPRTVSAAVNRASQFGQTTVTG